MKRFWIYFAVVGTFLSCDPSDAWKAVRRLVNETDHALRVEVLTDGSWFTTEIPAQGEQRYTGRCVIERGLGYCDLGWLYHADSARIIFDEERVLAYRESGFYDCGERNIGADPLYECHGYEPMEAAGDTIVYTYRITEADYQEAKPLVE